MLDPQQVGPSMTEPLADWVERVIDRALEKHINTCPLHARVHRLELRFASFIAFMIGTGVVGGLAGGMLTSWLGFAKTVTEVTTGG